MPLSLVAFSATVIYAALSCWTEGYHINKRFTEEAYAPIYRILYKTVQEFSEGCPIRCRALMASYTHVMQLVMISA